MLKEWITALRSGKYEQTQGHLRNGDSYCCLGVLCDVVDPKGWNSSSYDRWQHRECSIYPNSEIIGDLLVEDLHYGFLSYLNDSKDLTFLEIADGLEAGTFKGKTCHGLT
jgi:hypothetical protein